MSLEITRIADRDSWMLLADEWDALVESDAQATPFNTHAWLSLWWQHYGKPTDELCIVVVRDNGRLVGVAPWYINTTRMARVMNVRTVHWIGAGGDTSPDYLNFIAEHGYLQQVAQHCLQYLMDKTSWQQLSLTEIIVDSPTHKLLQAFFSKRPGHDAEGNSSVILHAELPDSWSEWRMNLSRKRRKQINHRQNRLDQAGAVELRICESPEQIERAVHALEELHRRRWVSKGAPGAFTSDAYIQFHRDVINGFYNTNQVWMATLSLNSIIIGVLYLFRWRDSLMFFQMGFDPEHESLSPGHVMFTYAIARGIEDGVKNIDLLKGDYKYKTLYAKNQRNSIEFIHLKPGLALIVFRAKTWLRKVLGK